MCIRDSYYTVEELEAIVQRTSRVFGIEIDEEAGHEMALRSRGTPRIANRILKRVRDFAQVYNLSGHVDLGVTQKALQVLQIDSAGLDALDRRILETIIYFYQGGPVGLSTIAANLSEDRETIEDMYEPYLIQNGFLKRTPRGRMVTFKAYEHLGIPYKEENNDFKNE